MTQKCLETTSSGKTTGSSGNPPVHVPAIRARLADVRSLAGWDLTHPYVETFWLPVDGPTATLLLRFVGRHVHSTDYVAFDNQQLAMSLGLGAGSIGQRGPVVWSFKRLARFGLAAIESADGEPTLALTVPPKMPVVREGLRHKWPASLHVLHHRAVGTQPAAASGAAS